MTAVENPAELPMAVPRMKTVLRHLTLLAMRGGSTVAKFLLAIYTARYLGLADLGIYGLLVGAVTIMPSIVGFGMTDWIMRKIVDLPRTEALPLIAGRLTLTFSIYAILVPVALTADLLLGGLVPPQIALLCAAIIVLENLGSEAVDMLIARRRILLAYWLTFLRTGAWPYPVMAIGLLYPETRTLECLLFGWLAMLGASWVIMLGLVLPEGRWRYLRPRVGFLLRDLHGSLLLYAKDVSSTVSMFIDRFLISMFLGLELTGVYTLFWSIANVVHSLSVYGVLQAQLPHLIATAQTNDDHKLGALERHLQIETGVWALLLALGAAIATPLMLPYLDRPLVQDYLPVFWLILFATLLRIAADSYGFMMLALHRDRGIAAVALGGATSSALLNLVLTPLAGLWGAAFAYAVTSGGLFAARFRLSRPRPSQARCEKTERRAALFRERALQRLQRIVLGMAWSLRWKRIGALWPLTRLWLSDLIAPKRTLPDPDPPAANGDLAGMVHDMSPETLIAAYRRGLFPKSHFGPLKWGAPAKRCVLYFGNFHISRRIRGIMRQDKYAVTFDRDFDGVIKACAEPRSGRWHLTWITPRIMRAYAALHDAGHAHSFEVWNKKGELVGGGYGVAVGGTFVIESQFARESNTSKIGFSVLCWHLARWGFFMSDNKLPTEVMTQMGFREISREAYLRDLRLALERKGKTGSWQVEAGPKVVADWCPDDACKASIPSHAHLALAFPNYADSA